MRNIKLYGIALAICLSLCIFLGCDCRDSASILGPKDKPDFKAMEWQKMEIVYWVLLEGKKFRMPRNVTISDIDVLSTLRQSLSISNVGPNSLGAGDQIKITMADSRIWTGGIVFGDRLNLGKSEDNYYSYILTLSDTKFYKALRLLCLEHEQTTTPVAIIDNIILRSNMSDSAYKMLPSNDKPEVPGEKE